MKPMKRCLRSLLPLLAAVPWLQPLLAEPVEVCVWTKDGNRTTLLLSEKPRMTFTADAMSMTTATTTLELPFSQLDKITYPSEAGEGIGTPGTDVTPAFVMGRDGSFLFQAEASPLQVMVVSMDGTLLRHFPVSMGDHVVLPASLLPAGSYLVAVNGVTYKIMKP